MQASSATIPTAGSSCRRTRVVDPSVLLRFILTTGGSSSSEPRRRSATFLNLNKEKARLSAMGIEPSAAEIARRLGVEEQEVSDMTGGSRRARCRSMLRSVHRRRPVRGST